MGKNIVILGVVTIVIIVFAWTFWRARRILKSWAAENGYQIVSSEIRWFRRGPLFWTTSKNQVVFYVTVRTHDGTLKQGWVRCGSWWWGVFKDEAEERWDE